MSWLQRKGGEPFFGRLEELRELQSAFGDTLSGRLNIVLLEGEVGHRQNRVGALFSKFSKKRTPQSIGPDWPLL